MTDWQQSAVRYGEGREQASGYARRGARRFGARLGTVLSLDPGRTAFLVGWDVLAALGALWLTRAAFTFEWSVPVFLELRGSMALLLSLLTIATLYYFDGYRLDVLRSRSRVFLQVLKASLITGVFFFGVLAIVFPGVMTGPKAVCVLATLAVSTLCIRIFLRDVVGFPACRVWVAGTGENGRMIAALLSGDPGYTFRGFLTDTGDGGPWSRGKLISHADAGAGREPCVVVTAEGDALPPEMREPRGLREQAGVRVCAWPQFYEAVTGRVATESLAQRAAAALQELRPDVTLLATKRVVDTLLAAALLFAAAPLMAVAAVLVKLTSPGPVFYTQERVGLHGRPFRLWKFRSMRSDAEKGTGPVWAAKDDPRITPLGRLLRKTRIDELPQLWNVLRGDMSLTGPRPERPVFVARFAETIPFYEKRLAVRPGLTGWAQVMHRYDTSEEDVATKLQYDLFYIKHWSLLLDLQIWIKTVATVLTGSGAH